MQSACFEILNGKKNTTQGGSSMAKVKYDVVAVTGKYKDPVTGEDKNKYVTCGRVIENDKGFSLKLDVVPISGEGWFNLWEPKKKNNNGDGNGRRQNDYARKDDLPPWERPDKS